MRRWFGWPSVVAAIMAVVIIATLVVLHRTTDYSPQLDYLRNELAKLDVDIDEVKDFRPMIGELLARKNIIETIERDRGHGLRLLNEVTRQRPEGVRLVSITFARGRLTVEGVAASEQALRNFTSTVAASSVLQPPEGLVTKGRGFSFRTALRAVKEQ